MIIINGVKCYSYAYDVETGESKALDKNSADIMEKHIVKSYLNYLSIENLNQFPIVPRVGTNTKSDNMNNNTFEVIVNIKTGSKKVALVD